jgi:hypothetical protein
LSRLKTQLRLTYENLNNEKLVEEKQLQQDNLDKYIKFSEGIAKNISKNWTSESLETKKRIQELVFPNGLVIDTKNRSYLTKKVNLVFELSAGLPKVSEVWNEKSLGKIPRPSSLVAVALKTSTKFITDFLDIKNYLFGYQNTLKP